MRAGNRVRGAGVGRKGAGVSRSNFESRHNRLGDWLKEGCGGEVNNEGQDTEVPFLP